MRNLQVKVVDSKSMLIHIQHGKGGRERLRTLADVLVDKRRILY